MCASTTFHLMTNFFRTIFSSCVIESLLSLRPRSNPPTQLVYLFMAARFQPCYGNNLITLILFLAFSAYTFTRKTRIISPSSLPLGTHTRVRVGWAARISYLIQFSFNILSVRKKHCEAGFVLFHARHVCRYAFLTSR